MADLVSFERDIRLLFTEADVKHMKPFGIDLSSRDSVAENADAIYETVSNGTMPPPDSGESRWTDEKCALFKAWQSQGCSP